MRLFILSDSPPEKDVQWSDEGIEASYKFIQKLWALNNKVINEINKNHTTNVGSHLEKITNKFVRDVTNNLENFSYNIVIANIHEMYSSLNKEINLEYKKEILIENYKKILACLMPIIPHLSSEALSNLENSKVTWPNYNDKILVEEKIIYVVQINGKKRALIKCQRETNEESLLKMIKEDNGLKKYLDNKVIKRKIFVPGKLINIII